MCGLFLGFVLTVHMALTSKSCSYLATTLSISQPYTSWLDHWMSWDPSLIFWFLMAWCRSMPPIQFFVINMPRIMTRGSLVNSTRHSRFPYYFVSCHMLSWRFVSSILVTNLLGNLTKGLWSNLHMYSNLVRTAMPPSFTFGATIKTTTLNGHVCLDLSCSHGYNLTMANLGWFLLTFINLDHVFKRIDLIHNLQPTNMLPHSIAFPTICKEPHN